MESSTNRKIKIATVRENNALLNEVDKIRRNAEKDLEMDENSPMDPPEIDGGAKVEPVKYEEMSGLLKRYTDDHKACLEQLDVFEKSLVLFKENGYQLNEEINKAFKEFFNFFDDGLLDHNRREERELFPMLHNKLIASGEKGEGEDPNTAVDLMEDDHVKFIQLGTLAFNMLGLASRLADPTSRMFVYDVAYNNGRELIELLRLHIYREDNILFPLAHKLITKQEFSFLETPKS